MYSDRSGVCATMNMASASLSRMASKAPVQSSVRTGWRSAPVNPSNLIM